MKNGKPHWCYDRNGNRICKRCRNKLVDNPKRLHSNGVRVIIGWLERTGVCRLCRATRGVNTFRTDWHHEKGFFIIFPWFGIIELCASCHSKEKIRLGEVSPKLDPITGKFISNRLVTI